MNAHTSDDEKKPSTLSTTQLRHSLQQIVAALRASADITPQEEGVLEDQRQRILFLLSRMERRGIPQSFYGSTKRQRHTLLSPAVTENDARNVDTASLSIYSSEARDEKGSTADDCSQSFATEASNALPMTPPHPVHRSLLGGLFSQRVLNRERPHPSATSTGIRHPRHRLLGVDEEKAYYYDNNSGSCPDVAAAWPSKTLLLSSTSLPRQSPGRDEDDSRVEVHHPFLNVSRHGHTRNDARKQQVTSHLDPVRRTPHQNRYECDANLPGRRSFWINVWPCFGGIAVESTRRPIRILVQGRCRYFEEVLEKAANLANCRPAAGGFYTPDGCFIRRVEELIAERHYLFFPFGGFYREEHIPTALLWILYTEACCIVERSSDNKSHEEGGVPIDEYIS